MKRLLRPSTIVVAISVILLFQFERSWLRRYDFESSDGRFRDVEIMDKGRSFEVVQADFEEYKRTENRPDVELVRTTRRNFLVVADWCSHPRWRCPYQESKFPNLDKTHNDEQQRIKGLSTTQRQ